MKLRLKFTSPHLFTAVQCVWTLQLKASKSLKLIFFHESEGLDKQRRERGRSLHTIETVLCPVPTPLAGRDEVVRESLGQVVAVTLHLDQVEGQGELVAVQHPVLVVVSQPPDLPQDVAGELGLEELLLGSAASYLSIVLLQAAEYLIIGRLVPSHSAAE